jgi:hypothetical protein
MLSFVYLLFFILRTLKFTQQFSRIYYYPWSPCWTADLELIIPGQLKLHPLSNGSAISKQSFQKILVLEFQMEESKKSMWMGQGRTALLKKGSHPLCQVREEKNKGRGLLVGHFYTTLKLEVGRQYVITCGLGGEALEPRVGAIPNYPNLACLSSPTASPPGPSNHHLILSFYELNLFRFHK